LVVLERVVAVVVVEQTVPLRLLVLSRLLAEAVALEESKAVPVVALAVVLH
jgi:hypothetical protein